MRVVVNAVSARAGGGLTYLQEVLPGLGSELSRRDVELDLVVSHEVAEVLGTTIPQNATVHTPSWAGLPGVARLLSEQTRLPVLLRSLSPAAIFHVGDIISPFGGAPQVLLCRNMLLYRPLGKNNTRLRALRRLARASLARATAVIFVSRTLADEVTARFHPSRWEVIHHGPGLSVPFEVRPEPLSPDLIVVGSIYDYKRVDVAIGAADHLRRQGVPATLAVVGRPVETRYVRTLEDQIEHLHLKGAVRFVGEAGPAEVARAYREATVAVVTSANESFCHPILEAFSAGTPVVVGADLRVAEEIAGTAAVFAEPTGAGFARAVAGLLADRALYDRHVEAGVARSRDFSWSKTAAETASLIMSVAETGQGTPRPTT